MRGLLAGVLAAAAVVAPASAGAEELPDPATRASQLANRCFVLAVDSPERYLVRDGDQYRFTNGTFGAAERFYVKPTGIGTLMLYDRDAALMSHTGAGVTRAADPGPSTEWSPRRAHGQRFKLRSLVGAADLAVEQGTGRLVTTEAQSSTLARIAFLAADGCRAYPEAELGAQGSTFKGTRDDGTALGFVDAHVHLAANLRAGGNVISGEPFNRYGIATALGRDAQVHGPHGVLDVTGNLLRSGNPVGTHDTQGWPAFTGWPTFDTYTHQQTYYRWLERAWLSGMRVAVAQTVEDTPLCNLEVLRSHSCDEADTVELEVQELRALERYVDAQSGGRGRGWLRLVFDPASARRAVERGKLAVLIGVESSNPFGCSEVLGLPNCDHAQIDAGIARMHALGVRTMFIAHWVDNALGGAALEGGDKGVFIGAMQVEQTGAPFVTGSCPDPSQGEEVIPGTGRVCNRRGLTDLGAYAVRRLMDAHMLIETDHLSEWGRQRLLSLAEERHYPLVSSHTNTGGLWTPRELQRLYAVGGFATARLGRAPDLTRTILGFAPYDPYGVGLGSDTGGFNALPEPAADAGPNPLQYPFQAYRGDVTFTQQRSGTRTFDLNRDGMAHYGLLPDLLADVGRRPDGPSALGVLFHSAEAYLRMWERA